MNGVFKSYKVYFNDQYNLTNSTNITLSGLEGKTNYTLYIKASTIEDSEPSNVLQIETLIGSKFSKQFLSKHQLIFVVFSTFSALAR